MFSWVLLSIAVATIFIVPTLIIWGWLRWSRSKRLYSVFSALSFAGFSLASASALLGLSTFLYARLIRPFPFYDPTLLRIYAIGAALSLVAVLFSIGGVWRPSSLRWHAPACAFGTLVFWILAASTE
jgi:hypothetical protein